MKTALSIAGSDSSGGAGIQADIKTMTMNGVYAMTAITALTAQNTMGVTGVLNVPPEFLAQQLDAVFTDICPDAVKIGMVSAPELVDVIADKLVEYGAENVVADPVLGATSGASLARGGTAAALCKKIFPLATVITPNIPEAEVLAGLAGGFSADADHTEMQQKNMPVGQVTAAPEGTECPDICRKDAPIRLKINSPEDMERAAKQIGDTFGCAVLLKGGHSVQDANDYLYIPANTFRDRNPGEASGFEKPETAWKRNSETAREKQKFDGRGIWFPGRRIDNPNTHGTGCTLSSAIAANLAKGFDLPEAVRRAKEYISAALAAGLDLGHGSGPLDHMV